MKIALIIVNYNGEKFLPVYLPDIANCCKESGISLIITDDQSTDGSIQYIKAGGFYYAINESEKHGFAANVNNGLRYAQSLDNYEYFIIANNDVQISRHLLPTLKKAIDYIATNDCMAGLIGCKEMFREQEYAYMNFDFAAYLPAQIKKTDSLPGCFFLISKQLLEEIGLMDEEYFMYGEDNDYFVRTLNAGYSIYNTNLPVMHYSEGSSTNGKLTSWYIYRNAFLFAQKNLGISGCIRMLISFLNQIYNPFYQPQNPGNFRVTRNGIFYNSYLLIKSIAWNIRYYFKKRLFPS